MDIQAIQEKLRSGIYYWRQDAIQRGIERAITEAEVVETIVNGAIIEAYPEDKYGLN
jgi:hypothetical protein